MAAVPSAERPLGEGLRLPVYTPLAAFAASGNAGGGGGGSGGLVPIRLDVDVGGHRLVDSFLLDPADPRMGPEQVNR